jgi:glycosyltransferase involved in cell wall biosynthesis
MKHVAIMIPGLNRIGGAEQQAILLACGLVRRGWRVTVVVLSGDGGTALNLLRASGVQFVSLRMRKGLADPGGWLRLHDWLRREKPEILHAHLPHAAWMARWSRLGTPVRVVIDTLHSSFTGTAARHAAYRLSDWLTDSVTAVSTSVAETHLAAKMVHEKKLKVLANGVDIETWRCDPEMRAATRFELALNDEFLWFAAGRLDRLKDYRTMLHALALTPQEVQLAIAGEGTQQEELLQLTTRLNLGRRVRFLGFKPDVRRWMQAADGLILSSLWEGLPMAILEAAACELPVVATDVAGTRDVVLHGQTGFLSPAGDARTLSESIRKVVQMTSVQRSMMGASGRRLVVERFSLEAALDRWENLYATLLSRNPFPRRYAC